MLQRVPSVVMLAGALTSLTMIAYAQIPAPYQVMPSIGGPVFLGSPYGSYGPTAIAPGGIYSYGGPADNTFNYDNYGVYGEFGDLFGDNVNVYNTAPPVFNSTQEQAAAGNAPSSPAVSARTAAAPLAMQRVRGNRIRVIYTGNTNGVSAIKFQLLARNGHVLKQQNITADPAYGQFAFTRRATTARIIVQYANGRSIAFSRGISSSGL